MTEPLSIERLREEARPRIEALAASLAAWPGEPFQSHRSASQLYHRLEFLADIGLSEHSPGWPDLSTVLDMVMADSSPDGPFRVPGCISVSHGGTGKVISGWALCDAPILVYALAQLGRADDPRVRKAVEHLLGLVRTNGWPCVVSPELGKFRGPGRKDDPCPYATLAMLKALSAFDDLRGSPEAETGAGALLDLWETSLERHPYMFFMGTDFRKLKAPFVWYDLLHVVEVLSRIPSARTDVRFREMLAAVLAKADADGRFTPESVWTFWSDWDFGQKKAPSDWMGWFVARILARSGAAG